MPVALRIDALPTPATLAPDVAFVAQQTLAGDGRRHTCRVLLPSLVQALAGLIARAEWSREIVSPAAVWTLQHFLGRHPVVLVVDSAGSPVEGQVNYDSPDQITLTFSAPFSGTAYLQ